ncbi:MAG: S41 family peptidase [Bacteroidales bacterium]|nr:S41 family peptidase [Bacteroidales bacterium]
MQINIFFSAARSLAVSFALLLALSACHTQVEHDNDPQGNFDALWTEINEHYCFFKYKDVDWDEVGRRYRAQIHPEMSSTELFDVCAAMLRELKDGHTNLISSFNVSRYWIWEQYPQNYDERLINEHYLNFNYHSVSGIKYQVLSNNFGYMYYGDFSNKIGEGNLDNILAYLAGTDGLIIDVRNNGGGFLTNVETLVGRFITEDVYAGSISHKTGPGHNDFSEPYDYYFHPAPATRIKYLKPVVVLTNRSSYSATNNFVSIMKHLPQVRIVGDTTGGGSGMPFTSEIPCGWTVRFSACSILDASGKETEFGVEPSEGCKVDMTESDRSRGRDTILETAFTTLLQLAVRS